MSVIWIIPAGAIRLRCGERCGRSVSRPYPYADPYPAQNFKALPHHSTRADRRENLCRKKAQNRRNTLRIARFCNAFVGQIGRQDVRGELCGVALNKCRGGTPLKKELLRLGIFMGVGFAARLLASCVRRAFCGSRACGVRTGPKLREGWTEKRARTPCAAPILPGRRKGLWRSVPKPPAGRGDI